jgi:outer membrane protein insertion porin family
MRSVSGCAYRSGRSEGRNRSADAVPSGGGGHRRRAGRVRSGAALLALVLVGLSVVAEPAVAGAFHPELERRRAERIRRLGPLVEALHFAGNETFTSDELLALMNTRETSFLSVVHFERKKLEQDLANVARYYESQGFLDARVVIDDMLLSDDGLDIEILIGVYEGPRWLVSGVTFEGNRLFSGDDLRAALSIEPGGPYLPNVIEPDRRKLLDAYARKSYLDTRVFQSVERDDSAHRAAVHYRIVEREQAVIASVEIGGNDKTRDFVVRRELSFSAGEFFNFKKIGESQARLYRTGLFNSVWIEPAAADTGKMAKRIEIRVRERPSGLLDFKAGYAAIDGAEVGTEFVNRNVQGQAIQLRLAGTYGERVRRARASLGDPWFMGRRIAIDAFGMYEWNDEVSFVAETAGSGFVLTKRFGRSLTVEGGYGFDRTVVLEGVADAGGAGTNYTSDLFAAVAYDTRDDILDAHRGMLARVETRFASSKLGGTNDFSLYELVWRGFRDVRHGRTLALSARVGWIKPQGEGGVPVNERYFAGGEGSVRGFVRNSLSPVGEDGEPSGGRALVELRAEVRFPVYKRLGAAAFVDAGQAFEDFGAITRSGLAVGAGGGLRFRTDFGVLRLDVATPVSESDSLQYYVGVGQAF